MLEDSKQPSLPKQSPLHKLDPFMRDGIIRVGGRLENSALEFEMKHPIVLPKSHHIFSMIIRWCHQQCQHGGRGLTLHTLRQYGYWVIISNTAVRSVVCKYVTCRKLRGKTSKQKMSELPSDRVSDAPVFSNCGQLWRGHVWSIPRKGWKKAIEKVRRNVHVSFQQSSTY